MSFWCDIMKICNREWLLLRQSLEVLGSKDLDSHILISYFLWPSSPYGPGLSRDQTNLSRDYVHQIHVGGHMIIFKFLDDILWQSTLAREGFLLALPIIIEVWPVAMCYMCCELWITESPAGAGLAGAAGHWLTGQLQILMNSVLYVANVGSFDWLIGDWLIELISFRLTYCSFILLSHNSNVFCLVHRHLLASYLT